MERAIETLNPAVRRESNTSSGGKLLDSLKKHLLELSDPQSVSKPRSNREVCNSLTTLTNNVITKSLSSQQVAANPLLLSSTIELLVYAYANVDQGIRLAASENLHKLIKSLMASQLHRLQMGLFHELKKNGATRSMCIVLECFSCLYSRTRPQKCQSLSQQFHPVLLRIFSRPEEVIQENSIESLGRILPTMTPFLTSNQVQLLMIELLDYLPHSTASYRRMMSATIDLLCIYSKVPEKRANWIITKLIELGSSPTSTQHVIQGVLLSFLSLLQHSDIVKPSTDILRQIYSLSMSAVKFGDHNTSNVALEVLENLLLSATPEFRMFLTTPLTAPTLVQNLWSLETFDATNVEDKSDLETQLDPPCDSYFEDSSSIEEIGIGSEPKSQLTSSFATNSSGRASPNSSISSWTISSCLFTNNGYLMKSSNTSISPLEDLVEFVQSTILTHSRISVQSVGLSVMTAAITLYPACLADFTDLLQFLDSDDPKLVSRMSQLLAQLVATEVRMKRGRFDLCRPLIGNACSKILTILSSEVPVVLKAACESLRVCLSPLLGSNRPQEAVELLEKLIKLTDINYWLLKVELLQTLAVIDYAQLAVVKPSLLNIILQNVVIPFLSDNDYRVRSGVSLTLVQLAKSLDHSSSDGLLSLGHQHAKSSYGHLHIVNTELSLAGIGRVEEKTTPIIPSCLEDIVWKCSVLLSTCSNQWGQRGSLEALCVLADSYPPPTLPSMWGVSGSDCGLLEIVLQLLRGSWLSWQVQTHHQLIQLSTSLFLACALDSLHQAASEGRGWEGGVERVGVVRHSTTLLLHLLKLLNVFQHVIEGKDPDEKEMSRKVIARKMENALSPKKPQSDHTPNVPMKEAIGNFTSNPHYVKLYNAVQAAYTNYKVSIDPADDDKFTSFLCQIHQCLAAVFEVSLAEEVGRHVEEIVMYISVTISVDAPGALLCLQQLLNALFGMNVATQQTHLYSPFLSSLPYTLESTPTVTPTSSLLECLVQFPLKQMNTCLHAPPPTTPLTPAEEQMPTEKKKTKLWLFGAKRNLVLKPLNSLSSIKDYLVYFEPLVVSSIQLFSYTSSLLIQERVLFMMVQLLHLKVRYDLLDCNYKFLESVNRVVSLMETGSIKGGAQLVPHLFQFLVMLAHDQSKCVSIPEVMQKCDAVMASGQNMVSFAIPALQPLVLYLFVRPSLKSTELATQREVVLNMLLRLIEYPRVIQLLICVLECYQTNAQEWMTISQLVFAALLAPLGRLQTLLDTPNSLSSLHQLLASMTPSAINAQGLILALTKQTRITSLCLFTRWLCVLSTILRLMSVVFPEETLLMQLHNIPLNTPTIDSVDITIPQIIWPNGTSDDSDDGGSVVTQLAKFLLESLAIGVISLAESLLNSYEHTMLPLVLSDILLLIQTLVKSDYPSLRVALSSIVPPISLVNGLINVSHCYPVLPLHFASLLVTCNSSYMNDWMKNMFSKLDCPLTPTQQLFIHCLLLLLPTCDGWVELINLNCHLKLLSSRQGMEFIKRACKVDVFRNSLISVIPTFSNSTISDSMTILYIAEYIKGYGDVDIDVLKMLAEKFVNSPVKVISLKALEVLEQLINGSRLSSDEAKCIMSASPLIKTSSVTLWNKLEGMSGNEVMKLSESMEDTDPLNVETIAIQAINKDWQKQLIVESFTSSLYIPVSIVQLLIVLDRPSLDTLLSHVDFNPSLLEECLVQGLFQTLTKRNSLKPTLEYSNTIPSISPLTQPETLLLASVDCLMNNIRKFNTEFGPSLTMHLPYLMRAVIWFLVGHTHLSFDVEFSNGVGVELINFAVKSLTINCNELSQYDTVAVECALDCCSLILQNKELISMVTDEWIESVTGLVVKIVEYEYNVVFEVPNETENITVVHQLNWVITYLLTASNNISLLSRSIHTLSFTLARWQLFFPSIFLPPILTAMEGTSITMQLLDQSLVDSDILQEYMQRSNLIGWRSRNHFEELWMQLLGVLNTPPPSSEMPVEELIAYNIGLCSGVRAVTSLLISTIFRPHPGNPSSSILMHTHRNKDFNFLSTPAGKKLLPHRAVVESYLLKDTAIRSSCYDHYQLPILSESSTFPPVYSRNLERPLGSTSFTPCQLSHASLVPVILKTDASTATSPVGLTEIDVRSCVLSLIDFYKHWLSQPIDLLLLHHILTSIVMLSDLFNLSNQYDWLLQTFLTLSETHPQEDQLSESLLVLGVVKSAAVLRVQGAEAERVSKLIEQSLSQNKSINTQNACLQGLLYVIEDSESSILTLVGPTIAKYILNHMTDYQSYSEHHILLVWALAAHLVLLQSPGQLTKDPLFTNHLLDVVIPIVSDSRCASTYLFQAIMLGLEYMVLSFSISSSERAALRRIAATRFVQSDHTKSLSSLALLITCMYTGEEADRLSGLSGPRDDMNSLSESVYQSREHISNILERLRQGNETEVEFLIHILPGLIVDFLPRMDAMNMVVSELISQQQSRPWLAALVMNKTFELLMLNEIDPAVPYKKGPKVCDWVLLSLDSFIQQEPEMLAVWSITCLLMAASLNPTVRALFSVVARKYTSKDLTWLLKILCTVAHNFYHQNNFPQEQKKAFVDKFDRSGYSSLHKVAQSICK